MREPTPGEDGSSPRTAKRGRTLLLAGLGLSVALHAVLLVVVVFPSPELRPGGEAWAFREVRLPPKVEVPEPPEPVRTPPSPAISEVEVEEPVLADGAAGAPPAPSPAPEPPRIDAPSPSERPALAPRDLPPLPEASDRFRRRLRRSYREILEERAVGGRVEVRYFVDPRGEVSRVEVTDSSGHPRLDRLARELVGETRYQPAVTRDRAVGVWVSQPICFVALERPGEKLAGDDCERGVALGGG